MSSFGAAGTVQSVMLSEAKHLAPNVEAIYVSESGFDSKAGSFAALRMTIYAC
jgi:hypothetical protein